MKEFFREIQDEWECAGIETDAAILLAWSPGVSSRRRRRRSFRRVSGGGRYRP